MQAVPKLSCKANIVSNNAVPASSKPRIAMIRPNEASTVPPGTPGAPIAKKPSKMINTNIVVKSGMLPYNICETVNTKNTSVKIEPHRWMFANRGTVTSITSSRKILLFLAQVKAVPKVAADDMVPKAVKNSFR